MPCDGLGNDITQGTPPAPAPPPLEGWFPLCDEQAFELADLLFRCTQMLAAQINDLLILWAHHDGMADQGAPFTNHTDMYRAIDTIPLGEVAWQSFSITYSEVPASNPPPWMVQNYDIWFHDPRALVLNQLANPDFKGKMDYAPRKVTNSSGQHEWSDFMTGNWSWDQAVMLSTLQCSFFFTDRFRRPLLQLIQKRMGPCLSPLCSEVTRQWCL